MLQQFEAAHSGQVRIDQQTGHAARMISFEEGFARRKILDNASICLKQLAESVSYVAIVVDNKDDLPNILGRFSWEPDWRQMPCGSRRRQKALDGLCQLLQPHRFVELDAVMTGNIAQRACRYVAGQDDHWDLTMKLGPQLLGNLKPIQPLWQIVIRKDEIRPDLASRDEIKRGDPVWRCSGVAALVLEQQIEETAHLGIIFDDQDDSSAWHRFRKRLIDFQWTIVHLCGV
jgi:hypothetical protein